MTLTLILTSTGWIAFAVVSIAAYRQIKQQSKKAQKAQKALGTIMSAHRTELRCVDRIIDENQELRQQIARLEYGYMHDGYAKIERGMK